jgi:hypothetical protein
MRTLRTAAIIAALAVCAPWRLSSEDQLAAFRKVIGDINDRWYDTCKLVSRDSGGTKLCNQTHEIYKVGLRERL